MDLHAHPAILWISCVLYASSLVLAVWRLALGKPYHRWPKLALVAPGFLLHTFFLWNRGISEGRCPVSNLFETLTFIAWCLVALHLLATALARLNFLTAFYMPLVLAIQFAALVLPTDHPLIGQPSWAEGAWLGMHASVILLAYAAFGLAGSVAVMHLVQERQLRHHRLSPGFMLLPPLLRLESAQIALIGAGFALLTLGLAAGAKGLHLLHPAHGRGDAKLLWSLVAWILYLAILTGRWRFGLRGRRLAWAVLAASLAIFSTFWLSNLGSQFHNY